MRNVDGVAPPHPETQHSALPAVTSKWLDEGVAVCTTVSAMPRWAPEPSRGALDSDEA